MEYGVWVCTTADHFSLSPSSRRVSLSSSVTLSTSSSPLLSPCATTCSSFRLQNSSIQYPLPTSWPSPHSADRPEWYSSISENCQAIPEVTVVTCAMALWHCCVHAPCSGWGYWCAAMLATPGPRCLCWVAFWVYTCIGNIVPSGNYPDVSFCSLSVRHIIHLPCGLRWAIPILESVRTLAQNVYTYHTSANKFLSSQASHW